MQANDSRRRPWNAVRSGIPLGHPSSLVIVKGDGEIVEASPPDEFFENPRNDRTKMCMSQILHH